MVFFGGQIFWLRSIQRRQRLAHTDRSRQRLLDDWGWSRRWRWLILRLWGGGGPFLADPLHACSPRRQFPLSLHCRDRYLAVNCLAVSEGCWRRTRVVAEVWGRWKMRKFGSFRREGIWMDGRARRRRSSEPCPKEARLQLYQPAPRPGCHISDRTALVREREMH